MMEPTIILREPIETIKMVFMDGPYQGRTIMNSIAPPDLKAILKMDGRAQTLLYIRIKIRGNTAYYELDKTKH